LWDVSGKLRSWASGVRLVLTLLVFGFPLWDNLPDAPVGLESPRTISQRAYGTQLFNVSPLVGSWVREITSPDECIYIFGTEPQMAFYAERRLCTCHILTDPVMGPYKRAEEFQEQVIENIRAGRPAVVIMIREGTSTLMRTLDNRLFKFLSEGYLDENYVAVAGVFTQDPDCTMPSPKVIRGAERYAVWMTGVEEKIQKMVREKRPQYEVQGFYYWKVPGLTFFVRKDLMGRVPKDWP